MSSGQVKKLTPTLPVAVRAFSEQAHDFAVCLSPDGVVFHVTEASLRLLGFAMGEVVGRPFVDFVAPADRTPVAQAISAACLTTTVRECEIALTTGLAGEAYVRARIFPDANAGCAWIVGADISSTRRLEESLRQRATHDALTGLPNRALLTDRVEWHIENAKRTKEPFSILMLDLDGFKKVNDALGHLAGDALLKTVAERLRSCVREVDTVSRTGGDEFVLVLPGAGTVAAASLVCERILDATRATISLEGGDAHVSTSVGVALYPEHGSQMSELLQHADMAMYAAKSQGKNRFSFFSPEIKADSAVKLSLDNLMHAAFAAGEFSVHYQPIVDSFGKIRGCEALMRWTRADGTVVPPSDFIPVAESNGLITLLGDYILRSAAMQLRSFDSKGLPGLYMSVNVSPRQLRSSDFEQRLRKVLQMTGVAPDRIVLEITESLLMNEQQKTQALLRSISALGVRFSLDDFGTGYSCLAYLKTYPISSLKIDRSFVMDVTESPVSHHIVNAIVGLAKALNLTTVAEGIETETQAEVLANLGVNYLQGYHFSRPVPPRELQNKYASV